MFNEGTWKLYLKLCDMLDLRCSMTALTTPLLESACEGCFICSGAVSIGDKSEYIYNGKKLSRTGFIKEVLKCVYSYYNVSINNLWLFNRLVRSISVYSDDSAYSCAYTDNINIPAYKGDDIEVVYYEESNGGFSVDSSVSYLDDICMLINNIGIWTTGFSFPGLIKSNGTTFNLFASEIKSISKAIESSSDRVLVYGINLGYYIYGVSNKEDVISVTVVEESEGLIEYFSTYIKPQFKNAHKIEIIHGTVENHILTVEDGEYDTIYVETMTSMQDTYLYLDTRVFLSKFKNTRYIIAGLDSLEATIMELVFGLAVMKVKCLYQFDYLDDFIVSFQRSIASITGIDKILDTLTTYLNSEKLDTVSDLNRIINKEYTISRLIEIHSNMKEDSEYGRYIS